jgi:hypothetical protein
VKNDKAYSVTYPGEFISINDFAVKYFDKNFFINNVFKYVDSVQKATDMPVLLGEFGLLYEQVGGTKFLNDMYEICIEKGWHFALWLYRGGGDGGFDYESKKPEYWETVLNMFRYTGLEDENTSEDDFIMIYPNPADDYLYLRFSDNYYPERIEIYSMLGVKMKSIIFENKDNQKIYVGDLPSGIYFVRKGNTSELFLLIH